MKTPSRVIARSWKMLLAELVVVFLGVYGAFWVEDFREQRDREERTAEVVDVLVQDVDDYIAVSGAFSTYMSDGLQTWDEAYARGEMPPPFVFRIRGAEKPPLTTWEVVNQAQIAELLEPNLLYELGFYYNELSGIGDRFVRYSEFTESEVLPLKLTGSAGFYDDAGDRLLPQFEAHMNRLREYLMVTDDSLIWAECLRDRIKSMDSSNEICRGDVGITPL
jgi:hypothetical protein